MSSSDPKFVLNLAVGTGLLLSSIPVMLLVDAPESGAIIKPIIVGCIAVAGVAFIVRGFLSPINRARRALKSARATNVADARPGSTVKLVGKLKLVGEPLVTPLGGVACAYYYVNAFQDAAAGATVDKPFKSLEVEKMSDFVIEDTTGDAFVHVTGAIVAVMRDTQLTDSSIDYDVQEAFLEQHGREIQLGMRYTEGMLREGERVAVLGTVEESGDTNHSIRIVAGSGRVMVTDDPQLVGP